MISLVSDCNIAFCRMDVKQFFGDIFASLVSEPHFYCSLRSGNVHLAICNRFAMELSAVCFSFFTLCAASAQT